MPPPPKWTDWRKISDVQARECLRLLRDTLPQVLPDLRSDSERFENKPLPIDPLVAPFAIAITALEVGFRKLDAPDNRLVGEHAERLAAFARQLGGADERSVLRLSFEYSEVGFSE
jgi:hypothetical protein